MFKRAAVVFTALSCLTLGIVMSVGLSAASGASSTLTLENNTGVTFTDNFNPVDSSSFAKRDERQLVDLRTTVRVRLA